MKVLAIGHLTGKDITPYPAGGRGPGHRTPGRRAHQGRLPQGGPERPGSPAERHHGGRSAGAARHPALHRAPARHLRLHRAQRHQPRLTGLHAAHSATTFLSGMPGMSMRRVCGVELRAFVRRAVPCRLRAVDSIIPDLGFPRSAWGAACGWRAREERILAVSPSWDARASTARRAPPL